MQAFSNFEGGFLLFIQNHLRFPVLNEIMCFITSLGNGGTIWIAIILALLLHPKTRRISLFCTVALLLNLLITNAALKNIIQRIRPYDVMNSLNILIEASHDFSFPSGHTSSSFAAAWTLWKNLPRKYGIPALVLASLIGFSRLYVGVHYPTDVLVGLLVGIFVAELSMYSLKKLFPKLR